MQYRAIRLRGNGTVVYLSEVIRPKSYGKGTREEASDGLNGSGGFEGRYFSQQIDVTAPRHEYKAVIVNGRRGKKTVLNIPVEQRKLERRARNYPQAQLPAQTDPSETEYQKFEKGVGNERTESLKLPSPHKAENETVKPQDTFPVYTTRERAVPKKAQKIIKLKKGKAQSSSANGNGHEPEFRKMFHLSPEAEVSEGENFPHVTVVYSDRDGNLVHGKCGRVIISWYPFSDLTREIRFVCYCTNQSVFVPYEMRGRIEPEDVYRAHGHMQKAS